MGLPDASDSRLADLTRWVFDDLGFAGSQIAPASVDASFRRYFRITRGEDSYIVMDAPPEKEKSRAVLNVAKLLLGMGLNAPVVLAKDPQRGLLFAVGPGAAGNTSMSSSRTTRQIGFYADALGALCTMQTSGNGAARDLPRYSHDLLRREMELMPEWFLRRHLGCRARPPNAACWIGCSRRWRKAPWRNPPRSFIAIIIREICW